MGVVNVQIKILDEIDKVKSGKYMFTISKVKNTYNR